jgi:hypothetical protein
MRRLACSLLVAVAPVLALTTTAAGAERPLWPGVTYERGVQFTPNGPVAISILRGPRPGGLTTLEPLLSNETLLGRETLTAMQRRVAGVATTAGVNGDYFTFATGRPSGIVLREGALVAPPRASRSSAGVTSDGTLGVRRIGFFGSWSGAGARHPLETMNALPRDGQSALFTESFGTVTPAAPGATAALLFPFPLASPDTDLVAVVGLVETGGRPVEIPSGGAVVLARGRQGAQLAAEATVGDALTIRLQLRPAWPGLVSAIGGGPQIVRDGVPVFRAGEAFTTKQLSPRAPRTAVGQTRDGRILLVAVDGRQPGLSVGMTNFELAQTLVRLGAVTGMALDGGGSTTMAFGGALLNSPSERERPIATALVFSYAGVFLPDGPARVSPNGDGVDDAPGLTVRVVRPSTLTTRLVAPDGVVTEATTEQVAGVSTVAFPPAVGTTVDGSADAGLGTWKFEASAIDDLGRTSTMARTFVVDDTLGFLRVARRFVVTGSDDGLKIGFRLARPARVAIRVRSMTGALLRSIPAASLPAGDQTLLWNGRDRTGRIVANGRYLVQVVATGPVGPTTLERPLVVRVAPGAR